MLGPSQRPGRVWEGRLLLCTASKAGECSGSERAAVPPLTVSATSLSSARPAGCQCKVRRHCWEGGESLQPSHSRDRGWCPSARRCRLAPPCSAPPQLCLGPSKCVLLSPPTGSRHTPHHHCRSTATAASSAAAAPHLPESAASPAGVWEGRGASQQSQQSSQLCSWCAMQLHFCSVVSNGCCSPRCAARCAALHRNPAPPTLPPRAAVQPFRREGVLHLRR